MVLNYYMLDSGRGKKTILGVEKILMIDFPKHVPIGASNICHLAIFIPRFDQNLGTYFLSPSNHSEPWLAKTA